jgi:hypothetical protein
MGIFRLMAYLTLIKTDISILMVAEIIFLTGTERETRGG